MERRFGVWLAALPLLAACGSTDEPVSGQSLALTAQANLEGTLRGLYTAGSFVADSSSLARMLSPLATGAACEAVSECPPGQVCAEPAPCESDELSVEDLQEGRAAVNDGIDELVALLREKIFTPENLESEDGRSATYRLDANTLCAESDSAAVLPGGTPPPGPGAAAPNSDCVEQVQKLQLRLRLSSPSDGDIDVALLVSASRNNPATLELHDDHVAIVVDLGELKAALDALGEETGELVELDGTVAFEVSRYAELDYGVRFSVRDAVHLVVLDEQGRATEVDYAASVPTAELRLDGGARTLTGTYTLGALSLVTPLDTFQSDSVEPPTLGEAPPPDAPWTGTIEAFLAGIDGRVTLDGSADRLRLENLGLGDVTSTVHHDGTLIAALDVNAASGRHFDLEIESADGEEPLLTISPTLDASLLLSFASLASQIDELPGFASNDTLRLFFEGDRPSVRPTAEGLEVVSGTLNLTSASVPEANLSVPAGQCLVELAPGVEPAHELLGELAVAACP